MTAPEWRAPPDTMQECLPSQGGGWRLARVPAIASHPEVSFDSRDRDRLREWLRAFFAAESEWASRKVAGPFGMDDDWMLLVTGSEWICTLVRDLKIGRFRVVRVVPLPKEGT